MTLKRHFARKVGTSSHTLLLMNLCLCACSPSTDKEAGLRNPTILRSAILGQYSGNVKLEGVLERRGNCLMVYNHAIFWHKDAKATLSRDGKISVSSKWANATVTEGDLIAMNAFSETEEQVASVKGDWSGVLETKCNGPYASGKFKRVGE